MPLGSNRDRHANIGEGLMGEGLGVFLAHPAFQHLSAYLEVAGADGHGPGVADLEAVRALHKRGLAKAKRRAQRAAAKQGADAAETCPQSHGRAWHRVRVRRHRPRL